MEARNQQSSPQPLSHTPQALPQALDDIVVVEFAAFAAGPCVGKYLSNHGAYVVKIESSSRPDGFRAHYPPFKDNKKGLNRSGVFAMNNDGVYSVGIDLKAPKGVAVARQLVDRADVVIENFTPGTMKRLGFGYDDLRRTNPGLVMLSTCNLGQTGPRAQHPGFGSQLTSLSGFTHLIGNADSNPVIIYGPYIDYIAVGYGYVAILAALDARRRTSRGQYIDLSQYETGIHFVAPAILEYQLLGTIRGRQGNRDLMATPHDVFPCAGQDSWCAISVFDDDEWKRLAAEMGAPDWSRSPRFATQLGRRENEADLNARLAEWTRAQDAVGLMQRLQKARVHAAKVNNVAELFDDPQLRHRHLWGEVVQKEVGPHHVENPAFTLSRTPYKKPEPEPLLCEHTDLVLKGLLGMTEQQILELAAEGAVERLGPGPATGIGAGLGTTQEK